MRSWTGTGRPCGCPTGSRPELGHADRQQTCLPSARHLIELRSTRLLACFTHLARDVASACEAGDDVSALRLGLWLDAAFRPARDITGSAASTVASRRRELERSLDDILAAPATCDLARDIQSRMCRARDQLLTFASFPGRVEAHDNACERDLRPAMIQRKNTDGSRAMWAAKGEAAVRRGGHRAHDLRRGHVRRPARHHRRLTALSQTPHPAGSCGCTARA